MKATACEFYLSQLFAEYARIDDFQIIFRTTKVGLSISVKNAWSERGVSLVEQINQNEKNYENGSFNISKWCISWDKGINLLRIRSQSYNHTFNCICNYFYHNDKSSCRCSQKYECINHWKNKNRRKYNGSMKMDIVLQSILYLNIA